MSRARILVVDDKRLLAGRERRERAALLPLVSKREENQ